MHEGLVAELRKQSLFVSWGCWRSRSYSSKLRSNNGWIGSLDVMHFFGQQSLDQWILSKL